LEQGATIHDKIWFGGVYYDMLDDLYVDAVDERRFEIAELFKVFSL